MIDKIKPGDILTNKEICSVFKCSSQGGMRKSNTTRSLILVSDHTRGIYEDHWQGNILHYTGMGLRGDQSLSFMQNKTLAQSNENSVSLHLFEVYESCKYIYQGIVVLEQAPYQSEQVDEEGKARKVWIFPLCLKDLREPSVIPESVYAKYEARRREDVRKLSDDVLDKRINSMSKAPLKHRIAVNKYTGHPEIKEKVKRQAKGICELCNQAAPFRDKHKRPYLEGHHIIPLSENGTDEICNVVALCPNCHRKMHILKSNTDLELLIRKRNRTD